MAREYVLAKMSWETIRSRPGRPPAPVYRCSALLTLNEVSHKVTVIYCLIVLISKCKSVLELKITVNEHFLPLLGTVSSTCFLGVGTSWYDTYVCDGLPQQARPATFFFPTRGCLVLLTSALPVAPRRFTLTRALPDPNLSPDLPHCICRRPPA